MNIIFVSSVLHSIRLLQRMEQRRSGGFYIILYTCVSFHTIEDADEELSHFKNLYYGNESNHMNAVSIMCETLEVCLY